MKIDLAYLKDVASGSSEFMVEMIDLFLDQTPGYFEQLNNFVKDENWPKVADLAHKIKPTLAFMGADSARDSMAEIETRARTLENTHEIAPAFYKLYSLSGELFDKLREIKLELEKDI